MDKTNKDYAALKDLLLHIHEVTKIQNSIDEKHQQKQELESIKIDYDHQEFPYYKARIQLEEDILKTTPVKILVAILVNGFIAGSIGLIPLIISFILSTNEIIPSNFGTAVLIISIILGLILFAGALTIFPKRIWPIQTKVRRKLLTKKREYDIELAKHQSIELVEAYYSKIKDKLLMIDKGIKLDEKERAKHDTKIEKSTILHAKYYKDIDHIFDYFETHRAETIKEAINLLESERNQQFYFERMLFALKHKELKVDDLLNPQFDPKSFMDDLKKQQEETALKLKDIDLETEEQTVETIEEDPFLSEVLETHEKNISQEKEKEKEEEKKITEEKEELEASTITSESLNEQKESDKKEVKSKVKKTKKESSSDDLEDL